MGSQWLTTSTKGPGDVLAGMLQEDFPSPRMIRKVGCDVEDETIEDYPAVVLAGMVLHLLQRVVSQWPLLPRQDVSDPPHCASLTLGRVWESASQCERVLSEATGVLCRGTGGAILSRKTQTKPPNIHLSAWIRSLH